MAYKTEGSRNLTEDFKEEGVKDGKAPEKEIKLTKLKYFHALSSTEILKNLKNKWILSFLYYFLGLRKYP